MLFTFVQRFKIDSWFLTCGGGLQGILVRPFNGFATQLAKVLVTRPLLDFMQNRLARLKIEIIALGLAYRDPRTPRLAKLMALGVVVYALSPIDLIPDPIPVLGYLDDVLLLPIGIWLTLRLIPTEVMVDCRARAATTELPSSGLRGVILIGALWLILLGLALWLIL